MPYLSNNPSRDAATTPETVDREPMAAVGEVE